jgi:putative transposase
MARPLRVEYKGAFYHVTARGNEQKNIYSEEKDYQKFLDYLREGKRKYGIVVHGYVLMTNHYHLLIETPELTLSRAMHYINGSYTTYINVKRKRSGHLFQGRYKAILVDRDSYLVELSRYIHLNPVRAGIVKKPEDYPMSSYRAFIAGKASDLVTPDLILGMVSSRKEERRRRYRAYVEDAIGKDMESPIKKVYGGMMLGSVEFIKETLRKIGEGYLTNVELSGRRELRTSWQIKEILEVIAKSYRIQRNDITAGKSSEAKKAAIYLIKRRTGLTDREIGEQFGGLSYSAVAKACRRLESEMSRDSALKRRIGNIDLVLSNVKG